MSPVYLTIVSSNYLAYARTLFESIEAHYPASRRVLCIVDSPEVAISDLGDRCTVLRIDDLDLPHRDHFLYRYGVMELNTAVKPYALRWIARNVPEAANGIMYIDPDIQFFRPLTEVEQLLQSGALLVLTPHLTAPLYDDKMPSELSIMRAGVYNCGFIAVGAHAQQQAFLDWWCRRLEFGAFVDFDAGLFTDQKWIDLAPGLFPDVRILRHPGYNVAYWNLAHRPMGVDGADRYTAGGSDLAFFHFSGIDPHDPSLLSKHQTRFDASDLGPFRAVYRRYFEKLLANGYDRYARVPYAFGKTKAGAPITPEMRQVFRHRYDIGMAGQTEDPFGLGPQDFSVPTDRIPKTAPRISVLLYEAWKRRELLRESFDIYSADGREGLLAWSVSVGERVLGVGADYIAASRRELERYRSAGAASPRRVSQSSGDGLLAPLRRAASAAGLRAFDSMRRQPRFRRLYYRIPERLRAPAHRLLLRTIGRFSLWSVPALGSDDATTASGDGVNMIGYFRGEFSIGECGRAFALAALECGEPKVALINFDGGPSDRAGNRQVETHLVAAPRYSSNLCFVNADQTPVLFDTMSAKLRGRHNIGYWFWELSAFPDAWRSSIDAVDEIWVASEFVRNAVATAAGDKPVRIVPYPVQIDLPRAYGRAEFGLPSDAFTFIFNFDYLSYVERKNPAALIDAFLRAFPGDTDVALVLKTTGAHAAPDAARALRHRAGDDARIVFLDSVLDRDSMYGLLSVADAYVSLHRSEGLGLGLAESMYLGKPVIGTGYSGNLQFMTRDNSCLVDYRLVDVPSRAYPHAAGQQWADPDTAHAAHWMRRIRDDAAFRDEIASRGREHVRRHMSRQVACDAVNAELERIRNERRTSAA